MDENLTLEMRVKRLEAEAMILREAIVRVSDIAVSLASMSVAPNTAERDKKADNAQSQLEWLERLVGTEIGKPKNE